MMGKRNPYLILGLDFGADASKAASAFARTARRLKRTPEGSAFTLEDATWALHQIEQSESDHADDVAIYRVPADPSVFASDFDDPTPAPVARTTDPDPAAWDSIHARIVQESLTPDLRAIGRLGVGLAYGQDPPRKQTGGSTHLPTG